MSSTNTPKLDLPLLAPSQAQKDVTVNETLRILDAITQGNVISKSASVPGSPVDGDTYIVPSSATGAWTGQDDNIAYYDFNAWVFFPPAAGWAFYVQDVTSNYQWSGSAWVVFAGGGGGGGTVYADLYKYTNFGGL